MSDETRTGLTGLRELARQIATESIPREWGPGAQRYRRHVLRVLDDAIATTPADSYATGAALRGTAAQADGGEPATVDPIRNVKQHPYRGGGTFELRVMEHGSPIPFPPHIVYIDRDEQDRRVTTFVAEVHENAIAHARVLAAPAAAAPPDPIRLARAMERVPAAEFKLARLTDSETLAESIVKRWDGAARERQGGGS